MHYLRLLLPAVSRRWLKQGLRIMQDIWSGRYFRMAVSSRHSYGATAFPYHLALSQPIRKNSGSVNKLENIRLAAEAINSCVVQPGQIFSFWRVVGRPDEDRGFRKGRNLVNGELREEYGGGLCQLASILYHASLLAGLVVTERHNHSVDIYQDAERYTPLGADAAVAYGYKDLRLFNCHSCAIRFHIHAGEEEIKALVLSEMPVKAVEVSFLRKYRDNYIEVSTLKAGQEEGAILLAVSRYKKLSVPDKAALC